MLPGLMGALVWLRGEDLAAFPSTFSFTFDSHILVFTKPSG
jgi:hypothetical protein